MNSYNPDNQLIKDLPLINCRELGGMPLEDRHVFRDGLFIRCGSPSFLSKKEFAVADSYGIGTVIDLRSEAELEQFGNPFRESPNTDFHSVPLFVGDPNDINDDTMDYLKTHHLGDYYVIIMEELGDRVVKIMRILTECRKPAIFHCAHGKDRTGVVAACLYLLAGASRENIILNYKVSYDYLGDFLKPFMDRTPDDMKHTLRSDAINMKIFLDYIDSKWNGDIINFFKHYGMSDEEILKLKEICVV